MSCLDLFYSIFVFVAFFFLCVQTDHAEVVSLEKYIILIFTVAFWLAFWMRNSRLAPCRSETEYLAFRYTLGLLSSASYFNGSKQTKTKPKIVSCLKIRHDCVGFFTHTHTQCVLSYMRSGANLINEWIHRDCQRLITIIRIEIMLNSSFTVRCFSWNGEREKNDWNWNDILVNGLNVCVKSV